MMPTIEQLRTAINEQVREQLTFETELREYNERIDLIDERTQIVLHSYFLIYYIVKDGKVYHI